MTFSAFDIMLFVMFYVSMTGSAAFQLEVDVFCFRFGGLNFFRLFSISASGKKKQPTEKKNEFDLHNLDTVP